MKKLGIERLRLRTVDRAEEEVSYDTLKAGALRIAAGLQAAGLEPRQTVAIMLPTSADYFYTYLGILLAGGVPVPIYPPARINQIEEHVRRHATILANAQVAILVTVPEAMAVARLLEAHVPGLKRVATPEALAQARRTRLLGERIVFPNQKRRCDRDESARELRVERWRSSWQT